MATPPQILDDAATPPGGSLPAMATPQILDATPPTDDEPDADALLAWPEICDLMNLQAPDAWRPRHAAVLAVRRRAQDEGGLDGRPPATVVEADRAILSIYISRSSDPVDRADRDGRVLLDTVNDVRSSVYLLRGQIPNK